MADTIKEIADQLSRIFRHMLPGLIVVGAAQLAHPSWFSGLELSKPWHLAALATITLAAGNTWYVLHRYTIHQFIDWAIYRNRERKAPRYLHWLSLFIIQSFETEAIAPKVRAHLHFRSAQIILMFILGEVLLLFSYWHDQHSFLAEYGEQVRWFSLIVLVLALVQYLISEALDRRIVATLMQKHDTKASTDPKPPQ